MESCDRCQRKNKLHKSVGMLHSIPVESKIFYQMGMDLIGPLPVTSRGNKYIVTLTDYFSKWAEAAPLPSKHAAGVAKFIYSVSIVRYFKGDVLHSFNVAFGKRVYLVSINTWHAESLKLGEYVMF